MCELFCLSSRIPTVATFSFQRFAARGGCDGHTIDGWGLAFYDGRDMRLYREPEPAGESAWLRFIAERRISSPLLLSHIRRATQGGVSLANTQPFAREMGGRMHCFAHNGRLAGVEALRTGKVPRFRPVGDTDSEIAFCMLLDRLWPLWRDGETPSLDRRLSAIAAFAAEIRPLGPANFLYSDGDAVFALGDRRIQTAGEIAPPGLWRLERRCAVDRDALARSGVMIDADADSQQLTLLASVPLTGERWLPFAPGELVAVKDGIVAALVDPRDQTPERVRF
jgi:predicted glutamine amidotransferase